MKFICRDDAGEMRQAVGMLESFLAALFSKLVVDSFNYTILPRSKFRSCNSGVSIKVRVGDDFQFELSGSVAQDIIDRIIHDTPETTICP